MNPRTPIEKLKLQANGGNLRRAIKRAERDPEFTHDIEKDISDLNKLIRQVMAECRKGSTIGEKQKRNPSFAILADLIRVRESLTRHRRKPSKPTGPKPVASFAAFMPTHTLVPDAPSGPEDPV